MTNDIVININGASDPILRVTMHFTTKQLLHLFSRPVVVIAAPGAGKYVRVVQTTYQLNFGTVAFVSVGADEQLYWGNGNLLADSGASAVFTDTISTISGAGITVGTMGLTTIEDQPVVFASRTQDMTVGDGTGKIVVLYTIVDIT